METEYKMMETCGLCEKCDCKHCKHINKISRIEKEIQNIVSVLESYEDKIIDEVIKRVYERRALKRKNV